MTYTHLSTSERYQIERWLTDGVSIGDIAALLARARSTIYRELGRLGSAYNAQLAQLHRSGCARTSAANAPRVAIDSWSVVKARLSLKWSPQQIAGRARLMGLASPSWQGIYRWVRSVWPQRRMAPLRRAHKSASNWSWAKLATPIAQRPAQVLLRQQIGHWEVDSMLGTRGVYKARLLVAVERLSRYTRLILLDCGLAHVVAQALEDRLVRDKNLPLQSVTVDRGVEFRDLPALLGKRLYVCDPQRPNQRGTNENTIGLLRQYLPKGQPMNLLTLAQVAQIERQMNDRPRQCLGFKTPAEVLSEFHPRCRTSI